MSAENFAEQGGGRRNPIGFRGRQRNYAEFNATDVKGFYLRIVLYNTDNKKHFRSSRKCFSVI